MLSDGTNSRKVSEAEQAQLDAQNARARAERGAKLADDKNAREQATQKELRRVQSEKIEAYRQQMLAAWTGTPAEFEAAWPHILQEWQIEQAKSALAARRADIEELL